MPVLYQTIIDASGNGVITGHDGTERPYSYDVDFTLPLGAAGAYLGYPMPLVVWTYKGQITAVQVNGVDCDRLPGPDDFSVVLPFDCTVGGTASQTPVTVGVPEWLINNGAANTLHVEILRFAQPPEDGDRTDVHSNAQIQYQLYQGSYGAAPLWTWGRNDEGQCADGTLIDVAAPRQSPDVSDAKDVWAGGAGPGPRA